MKILLRALVLALLLLAPALSQEDGVELVSIRPGVYLHRSYMKTDDFGKVDCNGLVYVVNGEALVIDTPPTEALSEELLAKVKNQLKATVIGLTIGHTHADSMGGLAAFQRAKIPSYASRKTVEVARAKGLPVPSVGYQSVLELTVGGKPVLCGYYGPGHAPDTSVTYLVEEKVLFGGCLVKAVGANKGYLGDADVAQWSATVRKVREAFPAVQVVVPGHATYGVIELLDYTIDLFAPDERE